MMLAAAILTPPRLRCSIRHPLQDERVVGRPPRSNSDDFCHLAESGPAPASAQVGLGTGRLPTRDLGPAVVASPRGCSSSSRFFGSRQRRIRPDPAFFGRFSFDPRRRLDGLFPARIGRARGAQGAAVADLEAVQPLELRDQGGRRSWLVAELVLRSSEQDGTRGFFYFVDCDGPSPNGRCDDGAEYAGHSDRPEFEYSRLERFRPVLDDLDKSDLKFDIVGASRSSLCGGGGRGRGC